MEECAVNYKCGGVKGSDSQVSACLRVVQRVGQNADSWAPPEFPVHKDWGVAPKFAFLVSSQVMLTQLMEGNHHQGESSDLGGSGGEAVTTQNGRDQDGERESGRKPPNPSPNLHLPVNLMQLELMRFKGLNLQG